MHTNIEMDENNRNNEKKNSMLTSGTCSNVNILTTTLISPQPGHTGFLTFATYPPVFARIADKST